MSSVKVNSTVLQDPAAAAREAANGISGAKLAFLYSSVNYDQSELIGCLKKEMPNTPIIGNTSFTGIITSQGYVSGDYFAGVMAFEGDDVKAGVAGADRGDCPVATGEKVAREAMQKAGMSTAPDYFYMVASPGEEEFFLKGITNVIGRVPFFGGSAADNAIAGDWKLFTDAVVTSDGVAVAFFYSDKAFANVYTGAYAESDKVGIITKIRDNRVLEEIDGVPALQKYSQWSGKGVDQLKGMDLLVASICNPLGVKDRLGDLVAIRHPMNGNDDLTINVGNNLATNTAVIYMDGSVDGLVASAASTLEKLKSKIGAAAGFHLVHCGGRRAGIGDRIDETAALIKQAAGDVPFIVEFTFGEYGFEADGNNTCGGLMLSYSAFAE